MSSKACHTCGEVKALDAFCRNKSALSGYGWQCKSCRNTYRAVYRKAHPDEADRANARDAAYRKAYPDKIKARAAAYKKAYPGCSKARDAADIEKLAPNYLAKKLGIRAAYITPELLALKREQIETHRLAQQVKQYLKEIKA